MSGLKWNLYCEDCRKTVGGKGGTGRPDTCAECGGEDVRWITTVTTDVLAKLYEQSGNMLYRTRRRLQVLDVVGRRIGGRRSRTYELLDELPKNTVIIGAWYDAKVNTRAVADVAAECADEVEALLDEMQGWRDSMEQSEGLMGTETYSAVDEAGRELDQIDADGLRKVPSYTAGQVTLIRVYHDHRLSRGWTRWQRAGRAALLLDRAADVADQHGDGEWASNARDASMVLEGIAWPRMFGG